MKVSLFQPAMAAIKKCLVFLPAGNAQQKPQEFERVQKLPTGGNIEVFGTFFRATNITEHVFDVPADRVWIAVKVAACDFGRNAVRPVVEIDERSNRIQNGRITQIAMDAASAWSPFIDEFVTEVTQVSGAQTKVTVVRKVMQRKSGNRWSPRKSNGRIEKYFLTQIADNLEHISVESLNAVPRFCR